MGKKVSMADQFYDSCCMEYTLKYRDPGKFRFLKCGGTAKVSSYGIEGVGCVSLIRVSAGLGKTVESAVFSPTAKDAPVLMMDDVRTLFGESMSINVFKTQISPLFYRQFSSLEESFGKLCDADAGEEWYNGLLIPGSVAKKGKDTELSGMLEEYLDAYLKILRYAEGCKETEKAEKTGELVRGFLDHGGRTADLLMRSLGREGAEEFYKEVQFPKHC